MIIIVVSPSFTKRLVLHPSTLNRHLLISPPMAGPAEESWVASGPSPVQPLLDVPGGD